MKESSSGEYIRRISVDDISNGGIYIRGISNGRISVRRISIDDISDEEIYIEGIPISGIFLYHGNLPLEISSITSPLEESISEESPLEESPLEESPLEEFSSMTSPMEESSLMTSPMKEIYIREYFH
jgi:hypothetical protein